MAAEETFVLHQIVAPSGSFDQIQDISYQGGIVTSSGRGDGAVDSLFRTAFEAKPTFSFSTTQINSALGFSGISGSHETSPTTMFYQAVTLGGTRTAAAAIKVVVTDCFIVPRSLSVQQGSEATLTYDLIVYSADGTTDPIVETLNQTVTGTPTVDELYTLGIVSVNGAVLEGVTGWTLDFGIGVSVLNHSGNTYPTFVGIMSRSPQATIQTFDMELLYTYATPGIAISGSGVILGLKAMTIGATAATSNSITLTINEGKVSRSGHSLAQDSEGMVDLLIEPSHDGSNAVIVIG